MYAALFSETNISYTTILAPDIVTPLSIYIYIYMPSVTYIYGQTAHMLQLNIMLHHSFVALYNTHGSIYYTATPVYIYCHWRHRVRASAKWCELLQHNLFITPASNLIGDGHGLPCCGQNVPNDIQEKLHHLVNTSVAGLKCHSTL